MIEEAARYLTRGVRRPELEGENAEMTNYGRKKRVVITVVALVITISHKKKKSSIRMPLTRIQETELAHTVHANGQLVLARLGCKVTPVTFVVQSGDGEEGKRERSCGLVPVCWKGELVQEPHHTDSRLVLRGTRADGARLTLMCDSTQSSRWISAPSTKWPLNSEFAACAFASYSI